MCSCVLISLMGCDFYHLPWDPETEIMPLSMTKGALSKVNYKLPEMTFQNFSTYCSV